MTTPGTASAARVGAAAFIITGFCRNCRIGGLQDRRSLRRRHRRAQRIAQAADGARVQLAARATRSRRSPGRSASSSLRRSSRGRSPCARATAATRSRRARDRALRSSRRRDPDAPARTAAAPPAASPRRRARRHASGEVDSMVLMRTMVRLRRFSSEPTLAARSASDGSQPSSRRSCFARGLELTTLAANATRPGVLAERVDHGAANPPLGKGLELDAAILVEAVGRVDEADDAVLHQVADVDRMRHGGRHPTGKGLDERQAGDDALALDGAGSDMGSPWLPAVPDAGAPIATAVPARPESRQFAAVVSAVNGCKALKKQRLECECRAMSGRVGTARTDRIVKISTSIRPSSANILTPADYESDVNHDSVIAKTRERAGK